MCDDPANVGWQDIAGRKCIPHVIYAKIWRWPDLHRNELKHTKFCSYGFDLKQDSVCINPYHYERIVSSVDLAALSLSPCFDHEAQTEYSRDQSDSDSELPDSTATASLDLAINESRTTNAGDMISTQRRPHLTVQALLDECDSSIHNGSAGSSPQKCMTPPEDNVGCFAQSTGHPNHLHSLLTDRVNPAPHLDRGRNTMAWSGVAVPGLHHPSHNGVGSPHIPGSGSVSVMPNSPVRTELSGPTLTPRPTQNPYSTIIKTLVMPETDFFSGSSSNDYSLSSSTPIIVLSGSANQHGGGGSGDGGNGGGGGGGSSSGGGTGSNSGSCGNSGRNAAGSNFTASTCGAGGGSGGGGVGGGGLPAGAGGGGGGNWGNRGGPPQPPFTPSGSLLQPVPILTSQRPPEFWCNIAYFELDQQVGELFKVPSQYSRVTVDGYTDPSSPNRFCLGQLSNVHRSEQSEKSRLYIGKGVELDNVGEGDVWIRCLSEFSVFVQSYYLDREAGRRPGDAVHKIYPGAYIKVFDIRQCHEQMKLLAHSAQLAAEHQAAVVVGSLPSPNTAPPLAPLLSQLPPGPSQSGSLAAGAGSGGPHLAHLATADVGVDDLRRLCMLRLSFVKGWGPDYPRRSIKETPCWIEIQLHRPLQLLDEVLQGMPLNDRKPTRHFFPYFSQPSVCPPAPRPQTARRP